MPNGIRKIVQCPMKRGLNPFGVICNENSMKKINKICDCRMYKINKITYYNENGSYKFKVLIGREINISKCFIFILVIISNLRIVFSN